MRLSKRCWHCRGDSSGSRDRFGFFLVAMSLPSPPKGLRSRPRIAHGTARSSMHGSPDTVQASPRSSCAIFALLESGNNSRGDAMPAPRSLQFDTLSLHAGQQPDPVTGARATPIYFTTSFVFRDADHAGALFDMERAGHVYSRISNPTNAVLEERIAALEGGVGAIATASGQAALHLAIATLMGAGSHIVASRSLYGGSHNLLCYTLPRFGIETTFVDPRDLGAWKNAVRPNTRLLFGEMLGNPGLDVLDIPAVADIAHAAKVPLLVDS